MAWALLLTQVAIGIRVSELLKLTVADLNFEQRVVKIRLGKGGKSREVPLGERTVTALREWLHVRELWLATRNGDRRVRSSVPQGLWLADRSRGLSVAAVSGLLDEVCFHAHVEVRIRIHDLRALTAQRWKRDGVPMEVIQTWLGHSDPGTTKVYVRSACADTREWARRCDLPLTPEQGRAAPSRPPVGQTEAPPAAPEPNRPERRWNHSTCWRC
ncbi:MAG: tyrosine-type recombinase/integrase [Armatimonadota bacterium]